MQYKAQLNNLLLTYVSIAAEMLGEEKAQQLNIGQYQRLMVLLAECIELEHLMDKVIARHAIEQLESYQKPEQAVMHCFVLYIYRLCALSSKHPLEEGIIKQKIINILPMFEQALNKGAIECDIYDKNADALACIADQSSELEPLINALANEYMRLDS
jgi:hypothetical protein